MSSQLLTPSTSAAHGRDSAGLHKPAFEQLSLASTAVSNPRSRSSSTAASHHDREADSDSVNARFHKEAYGPDPGEKGWDPYEVRFAPDDPDDPHNWSRAKRWYITLLGGLLVLNAYVSLSQLTSVSRLTLWPPGHSRVQRPQGLFRR